MIQVGVVGAGGKMGSETCSAVEEAVDLELVARVGSGDPLESLVEAGTEVAVEFTTPATVKDNVGFCIASKIHTVVGATGLSDEDLRELDEAATDAGVGVFVAPNFALGAVLMMRFAELAAPHFDWAEITERHHEGKLDAPSGTALRTADMMSRARSEPWSSGPVPKETLSGARGGDASGVRIHSLRLPGSVAHQEVIFGAQGETLSIRHDSLNRSSFMPGVVLAIREVSSLQGVTVGLEKLLDL